MISLKEGLEAFLRRHPSRPALLERRLDGAVRLVLGESIAPLLVAVRFHQGTLDLVTQSPALAHQMRLDEDAILARIEVLVPDSGVRRLRVVLPGSTGR